MATLRQGARGHAGAAIVPRGLGASGPVVRATSVTPWPLAFAFYGFYFRLPLGAGPGAVGRSHCNEKQQNSKR